MGISNEKRRRVGGGVVAVAAVILLLGTAAWSSSDLNAARDAGTVGERRDGYIGLVVENPSAEQKALVKEVNARRRAQYIKIAKKTGATPEAAAALTAERLFREAKPGHYLQAVGGGWMRKP